MKRIVLALSLALPAPAVLAAPAPGKPLPAVSLEGKAGGRVDGSPWSSAELTGKVHVLFYVDPDQRKLNDHVADALKAERFDRARYGSVAVINLAASWLPNAILESSLEEKQKEFPDTVYVRDRRKALVERWGLADHSNDVLALDREGRVIFYRAGRVDEAGVAELIRAVRENLAP